MECPPNFQPFQGRCIFQYTEDHQCCNEKLLCDENKINQLNICEYNGEKYHVGERFEAEMFHECLCTENFKNVTAVANPDCEKRRCGLRIHNSDKLNRGCLPVFYRDRPSCPIEWICPEDVTSTVDPGEGLLGHGEYCAFGDQKMKLGSQFEHDDNTCECSVPPIATCWKTENSS